MLLPLNLGWTSNQRSIPLGYLLQLLVHSHQGLLLCFMESSQLKNLLQKETRGQEIPQWLMYRYSRRPFWTGLWVLPVSGVKIFFGNTLFKCWYISISKFSDSRLKEFCCICNKCTLTSRNEKSQIRKIQAF